MKIGAIILAAGVAKRFGTDKRLQPLGQNTVATTTLSNYAGIFDATRLVVRSETDPLLTLLSDHLAQFEPVFAADADKGMGHSLSAGFNNLKWDYAFVALADMPFLKRESLECLINSAKNKPQEITRPTYHTQPGHPVGFPAHLFDKILRTRGDTGARDVLRAYNQIVNDIEIDDPGVLVDIDTPEDLRNASSNFS